MSATSNRMEGEENNNSYILLIAISCHHHWSDEEFIPRKILGLWVSSGTWFASKLWRTMPGDMFWRSQRIVVTAGTNGIADGEVGDEKRELGKMEQGCVVTKSLKVWEKEKLVERKGQSSWGIVWLRREVLALVCFNVFSKVGEDIPPERGSPQVWNIPA